MLPEGPPPARAIPARLWDRTDVLLAILLAFGATVVFWPVLGHPFHLVDDAEYVTRQPMVAQGFCPAALLWAWTQPHSANWHPLTTLAHMSVCQFWGADPRAHHAASLLLHALNGALCFAALRRLTGRRWESAAVATLFAVHPLRVESVAWVAELKDVLCGTFWFLTLWAYARYVERRTRARYALVALGTAAALLAKPMAVTLPCVLLLLDYWPLRRWPALGVWPLVREKAWLFLLVAAQAIVTYQVQRGAGASYHADALPFDARLGNALVSYLRYLGKFLWPDELSAFYPHPTYWSWPAVLLSGAVLLFLTCGALALRRTAPWVITGWLLFLGTLVPVIGLVQVGSQAMADRYTYLPTLGLAVALLWTVAALLERARLPRLVVLGFTAALFCGLTLGTRATMRPWRDPVVLFERAAALAPRPGIIRSHLGNALREAGRLPEAEAQFRALVREEPWFSFGWLQLATVFIASDRAAEAAAVFEQAIRALPDDANTWNNLGVFCMDTGAWLPAAAALEKANRLEPGDAPVQNNLGLLATKQALWPDAERHFTTAVRLDPWNPSYRLNLAIAQERFGRWPEAHAQLIHALWINPRDPALLRNAITLLERHGEPTEAAHLRARAMDLGIDYSR